MINPSTQYSPQDYTSLLDNAGGFSPTWVPIVKTVNHKLIAKHLWTTPVILPLIKLHDQGPTEALNFSYGSLDIGQ